MFPPGVGDLGRKFLEHPSHSTYAVHCRWRTAQLNRVRAPVAGCGEFISAISNRGIPVAELPVAVIPNPGWGKNLKLWQIRFPLKLRISPTSKSCVANASKSPSMRSLEHWSCSASRCCFKVVNITNPLPKTQSPRCRRPRFRAIFRPSPAFPNL